MVLTLSLLVALSADPAPVKVAVSGVVQAHASLCGGGAAVTTEQVEALPPPSPRAGVKLAINRGNAMALPVVATVTTDAKGRYSLSLPKGTWCLWDASRPPPPKPAPAKKGPDLEPPPEHPSDEYVDAACVEGLKVRCDLVLEVTGPTTNANVDFMEGCPQPYNQPCWRGPMPP